MIATTIQTFLPGHGGTLGSAAELRLNPESGVYDDGGKVLIGTTTAINHEKLIVDGGTNTKGFSAGIKVVTTLGYGATNLDHTLIVDISSANNTIYLPSTAGTGSTGVSDGKIYYIQRYVSSPSSTNTLTIKPNGTETIDGQVNHTINTYGTSVGQSDYKTIQIQRLGTNWYIISKD